MTIDPRSGPDDVELDPDGDPEMLKDSASQPNQAEGDDDPSETGLP